MTVGVVDSTVIIHVFRKNPAARAWLDAQPVRLLVTPITWMEVMHGAPGKAGQATCKAILSQFDMEYLTPADMNWGYAAVGTLSAQSWCGDSRLTDCGSVSPAASPNLHAQS